MPEENLELVRRFVGTWAGRDWSAETVADPGEMRPALEMLHPNFEVRLAEEVPGVRTYRGPQGALEAYADWHESWETFRMDPLEFTAVGEGVVVTFHQSGRGRVSGIEAGMEIAQLFTVRDGMISGQYEFTSKERALRAAKSMG